MLCLKVIITSCYYEETKCKMFTYKNKEASQVIYLQGFKICASRWA